MVRRSFHRPLAWLKHDLRAALSLAFLAALLLLALTAPLIAPYPVTAQDVDNTLAGPSAQHLLGTDDLGRDVFSRMVHGGAATLYASGLAVGIALLLGLPVGLLAGTLGGWVDDAISRFIDALLSFPSIVLAIAVTGALGIGLIRQGIGGFFAFQPLQHLFVLYDFGPGLQRYLGSLPLLAFTLVSVASLSFMLSCFNMKPAAATICTLTYFLTDSIFKSIPYFESLKPWFITSHVETWYNVYRSPVPWFQILEDLAYLAGVDATFLVIGIVAFSVRDFKS